MNHNQKSIEMTTTEIVIQFYFESYRRNMKRVKALNGFHHTTVCAARWLHESLKSSKKSEFRLERIKRLCVISFETSTQAHYVYVPHRMTATTSTYVEYIESAS